jgi:hypothetical protein
VPDRRRLLTRQRFGRIATRFAAVSTALLLVGVGVGTVSAANPAWFINITPTPAKVGAGHDAGFIVTVGNHGPSQINDLRVIVTPTDLVPLAPGDEPTFLGPLEYKFGGTADCTSQLPLTCLLGTLEDDEEVTFTVAYGVPTGLTGNFDINVAIRAGTGDPEGKNNSRGDKFDVSRFATIGSGNFDGGFVVGADSYQTNPNLGNKNIQSTGLFGAPQQVGVTIEDGASLSGPECPTAAGSFGECSLVHVGGGESFPAFKVVLVVRGSSLSGNPDPNTIIVHHTYQSGIDVDGNPVYTTEVIGDDPGERCASENDSSSAPCVFATKVGSNYQIVVWLLHNGGLKGGI